MERKNSLLLTSIAICVILGFASPAFSAGENMMHTSAGKVYAGYGYTHGDIPVTEGNGGYYDSDIYRYDINNLKRANYYYTQEDLEYHTRGGNQPLPPNAPNAQYGER